MEWAWAGMAAQKPLLCPRVGEAMADHVTPNGLQIKHDGGPRCAPIPERPVAVPADQWQSGLQPHVMREIAGMSPTPVTPQIKRVSRLTGGAIDDAGQLWQTTLLSRHKQRSKARHASTMKWRPGPACPPCASRRFGGFQCRPARRAGIGPQAGLQANIRAGCRHKDVSRTSRSRVIALTNGYRD